MSTKRFVLKVSQLGIRPLLYNAKALALRQPGSTKLALRANRSLCTQRQPVAGTESNQTRDKQRVLTFLATGITTGIAGGGLAVNYYRNYIDSHQNEEIVRKRRDEMWKIAQQPPMAFPRPEQKMKWRQFIKYQFSAANGAIAWMYGPKAIGKSTLLKRVAYELQQELKSEKKRVFYVDLETARVGQSVESLIHDLECTIRDTVAEGFVPCVILDAIGPLCEVKGDLGALDDDTSEDEFTKLVAPKGAFVVDFFRCVKGFSDKHGAIFVFLTSKPFHLAINDRRIAWNIKDRSEQFNVSDEPEFKYLDLRLSKKGAIEYVEAFAKYPDTLVSTIQSMTESDFQASDYCRIGRLKNFVFRSDAARSD